MAYQTVTSLDCDVVYPLGGVNSTTGVKNPTTMEGYYLGSRPANIEGQKSTIHVFQTPKGNQGIWGSADTNQKLSQVTLGTMTLVEFKEKKKISGGKTKKIFAVSQDPDNTITVSAAASPVLEEGYIEDDSSDDAPVEVAPSAHPSSVSKVQELLNRNKSK